MRLLIGIPFLLSSTCSVDDNKAAFIQTAVKTNEIRKVFYEKGSWQYFLQHLPVKQGAVIDYAGRKINNQSKHFSIVNYDVGERDLQQCADAIMRLRAEYLFSQKRFNEIQFHFTSGDLFRFTDYCNGKRPIARGNKVIFITTHARDKNYKALRDYLDIVYTYAGTISLAKELTSASKFEVGTIIITPGSPGHCSIIVDEAKNEKGEKLFKLAEGYTPAQSIYILKNPEDGSAWYKLKHDNIIETSSYLFKKYALGVFE